MSGSGVWFARIEAGGFPQPVRLVVMEVVVFYVMLAQID